MNIWGDTLVISPPRETIEIPDWNENDPDDPAYIRNRPFYTEDNQQVIQIPNKYIQTVTQVLQNNLFPITSGAVYSALQQLNNTLQQLNNTINQLDVRVQQLDARVRALEAHFPSDLSIIENNGTLEISGTPASVENRTLIIEDNSVNVQNNEFIYSGIPSSNET